MVPRINKILSKKQQKRNIKQRVNNVLIQLDTNQKKSIAQPCASTSAITFSNLEQAIGDTYETSHDTTRDSTSSEDDFSRYETFNEKSNSLSLKDSLRIWSLENNITHKALSELLVILEPYYKNLPLDPRTLLQTPRTLITKQLLNGKMFYFGIHSCIQNKLLSGFKTDIPWISVQINIDGLPLFSSSATECFPILGRCLDFKDSTPFAIAVYCGTGKPNPLQLYLEDFIKEVLHLYEYGVIYEGKKYEFRINLFTCDAPARAYLKNIVGHTSKQGCEKCKQEAVWISNRIVYKAEENSDIVELRKDADFHADELNAHIKQRSPLLELKIGLVSQFVLDPMHLIYLGVTKRLLLSYWIEGKPPGKLSRKMISEISDNLLVTRKYVCSEFARKPRSLLEIKRWKATEYRFFLLYGGIVVLKTVLSKEMYSHFLLLHCATYIITNNLLIDKFLNVAKTAILKFIGDAESIYGETFNVYNVHSMQHIIEDVKKFGSIENFSCFPFENYLGGIKKFLRAKSFPLQQICKRLKEIESINKIKVIDDNDSPRIVYEHNTSNVKKVCLLNLSISSICPDNVIITKTNKIFMISKIEVTSKSINLIGRYFKKQENFYEEPLASSLLNIYYLEKIDDNIRECNINKILNKCVLLPYKQGFVAIPMSHGAS